MLGLGLVHGTPCRSLPLPREICQIRGCFAVLAVFWQLLGLVFVASVGSAQMRMMGHGGPVGGKLGEGGLRGFQ